MSQLYENDYNDTQWEYTVDKNAEYHLVSKKDKSSYSIGANIIGIKQIDDETFLIHRHAMHGTKNIGRFKFTSNKSINEFSTNFRKFTFLTDDTILFDNKLIYSISKNGSVPESEWLKNKKIEVNTDVKGKLFLFVEVCISPLKEYVQVLVDIHNFKPVSKAYSTLRDSYITLTDSFTFDDLIKEDTYYDQIVQHYFSGVYYDFRIIGQQTLLKEYNEKQ